MTADEAYLRVFDFWTAAMAGESPIVPAYPDERQVYGSVMAPVPRPERPYAMILCDVPESSMGYGVEVEDGETINRNATVTWRAEINTFDAKGALASFRRFLDGRASFTGANQLEAAGLGVGRILSEPRAVTLALDVRREYRERMEVEFNAADTFAEAVTTATAIQGTVDIETASGDTIESDPFEGAYP